MKTILKALSIPVFVYIIITLFKIVANGPAIKDGELLDNINKAEVESRKELVDCAFFKMDRPEDYKKFVEWDNKKIKIKYFYSNKRGICAESSDVLNSVWINVDNIFNKGCLSLGSTLGHEMMHLAGLPGHNFKDPSSPTEEEIFTDTIYLMEIICLGPT